MKKKLIIIIVVLVVISILLVWKRKSIYNYIQKSEYEVVSVGDMSINYFNGKKVECSISEECDYSFSVSNSGDVPLSFAIGLLNTTTTFDDVDNIKYTLKANEESFEKVSLPIDGNLVTKILKPHQTIKFSFSIFYEGSAKRGKINSEIYVILDENIEESFTDLILSNNPINDPKTTVGLVKSTENEGLINSNDDYSTTYYFRGNVNNNYVRFANLDWRIIRINGNNTVKLILADNIEDTLKSFSSNDSVGDNFIEKGDFSSSTALSTLKEWYSDNLSKYDRYIANTKFCIDNNSYINENGYKYYYSYVKNQIDKDYSLMCDSSIDLKIGLISASEALFAGATLDSENSEYYLYSSDSQSSTWTLSAAYLNESNNDVNIFSISPNGQLESKFTSTTANYLRPVISLNSTITATGNGTLDDPYIIEEK